VAGAVEEAIQASRQEAPEVKSLPRRHAAQRLLEGRGWTISCLVADVVALVLAIVAALVGANAADVSAAGESVLWLFPPLVIVLLAMRGRYRQKFQVRVLDELGYVIGATSAAAMSLIAAAAFTTTAQPAALLARVWLFGAVYVCGARLVLIVSQRHARAERVLRKPTLIVGAGRIGAQVERRLNEQPELGLDPVGYIDAHPPPDDFAPDRSAPILGGPFDLPEIVERTGAEHLIVAFMSSRGSDGTLIPLVRQCEELGLGVSLVPRLFESMNVRVELEHIGGMPLLQLRSIDPKGWQFAIKYALDRAVATVLLALLSPLILLAALLVRVSSPGPIFFRQRRVGRDGHDFDLLKFRSMKLAPAIAAPNVVTFLARDTAPGGVEGEDRRTVVGTLLRRFSIDELPQLVNVIKGEMSLVGPRPERPEFVELFAEQIHRYEDRHRVKAGITGWAQVHDLRGKTSLSDRIEWDNYYISNWSLRLDFKILLMTVTAVFRSAE